MINTVTGNVLLKHFSKEEIHVLAKHLAMLYVLVRRLGGERHGRAGHKKAANKRILQPMTLEPYQERIPSRNVIFHAITR